MIAASRQPPLLASAFRRSAPSSIAPHRASNPRAFPTPELGPVLARTEMLPRWRADPIPVRAKILSTWGVDPIPTGPGTLPTWGVDPISEPDPPGTRTW